MTEALITGRRADSHRRRERVKKALDRARDQGHAVSVASIARAAGVDRSFLYRHPDLLANIHTSQATPTPEQSGVSVTNASLRADLVNANNASHGWPPRIGSWNASCPRPSASRHGSNQASAQHQTSTSFNDKSPDSNNATLLCNANWNSAKQNSMPPAPPTES